jgi:hypothetical protein
MKKIEFGKVSLPLYPKGTNFKFRVLKNLASSINEEQQCLLDTLWNTRNDGRPFLDSLNALTYYFSQLNNSVDSSELSFFADVQSNFQDSSSSTQIGKFLEMPPLGRETFTPLVKDKGEQCELISLSLDRQPLSPLDKEKSVEANIFSLPQELNDKIFQIAEDRSQGLLIKLQQYFFNNKVTIPGLASHITGRYLGNPQNLLFQFVQVGINLDICPNPLPIPIESMTPITVELLLDYGMISQIWLSDKAKLTNFPYKLRKSCELNLFPNKSLFVDIDSIPPEWVNENNFSYKLLPSYHLLSLYTSSSNDSERFYNQIEPTNYKFSVIDIQRRRAHMYTVIQMRFQEGLLPRIIAQTPHMTICSEIRKTNYHFCPVPQLWNSSITKKYIADWKLHLKDTSEEEDYAYYEGYDEEYDFDEEAIHNLNT